MNSIGENVRELRPSSRSAPPEYWTEFAALARDLEVEISTLDVTGGAPLYLYEAGPRNAPRVLLINPAEAPFLMMSRLFSALSGEFRVIAWDNTGNPFMADPDRPWVPATIARMAGNLRDILAAREIPHPHVVTWCAGALIYLWAFAAHRIATTSLSLIAPPGIVSRCPEKTPFQTFFLPTVLQLASGHCVDEASLARRIRAVPKERMLLDDVDRAIFDLSQLATRDDAALRRYAQLIRIMCSELPPLPDGSRALSYADVLDEVCRSGRVSLLHCQDDDIFSVNCSREVAARHPDVRLKVYATGGHFVLFREPQQLAPDIAAFIRAGEGTHGRQREAVRG
jgi:pimeloyl-ACP methyl ester carboxylesterase